MYFYAPSYTDSATGSLSPGIVGEDGSTLPADSPLPSGSHSVHYDADTPRFVVQASYGLAGWLFKTKAQVEADYPGVLP